MTDHISTPRGYTIDPYDLDLPPINRPGAHIVDSPTSIQNDHKMDYQDSPRQDDYRHFFPSQNTGQKASIKREGGQPDSSFEVESDSSQSQPNLSALPSPNHDTHNDNTRQQTPTRDHTGVEPPIPPTSGAPSHQLLTPSLAPQNPSNSGFQPLRSPTKGIPRRSSAHTTPNKLPTPRKINEPIEDDDLLTGLGKRATLIAQNTLHLPQQPDLNSINPTSHNLVPYNSPERDQQYIKTANMKNLSVKTNRDSYENQQQPSLQPLYQPNQPHYNHNIDTNHHSMMPSHHDSLSTMDDLTFELDSVHSTHSRVQHKPTQQQHQHQPYQQHQQTYNRSNNGMTIHSFAIDDDEHDQLSLLSPTTSSSQQRPLNLTRTPSHQPRSTATKQLQLQQQQQQQHSNHEPYDFNSFDLDNPSTHHNPNQSIPLYYQSITPSHQPPPRSSRNHHDKPLLSNSALPSVHDGSDHSDSSNPYGYHDARPTTAATSHITQMTGLTNSRNTTVDDTQIPSHLLDDNFPFIPGYPAVLKLHLDQPRRSISRGPKRDGDGLNGDSHRLIDDGMDGLSNPSHITHRTLQPTSTRDSNSMEKTISDVQTNDGIINNDLPPDSIDLRDLSESLFAKLPENPLGLRTIPPNSVPTGSTRSSLAAHSGIHQTPARGPPMSTRPLPNPTLASSKATPAPLKSPTRSSRQTFRAASPVPPTVRPSIRPSIADQQNQDFLTSHHPSTRSSRFGPPPPQPSSIRSYPPPPTPSTSRVPGQSPPRPSGSLWGSSGRVPGNPVQSPARPVAPLPAAPSSHSSRVPGQSPSRQSVDQQQQSRLQHTSTLPRQTPVKPDSQRFASPTRSSLPSGRFESPVSSRMSSTGRTNGAIGQNDHQTPSRVQPMAQSYNKGLPPHHINNNQDYNGNLNKSSRIHETGPPLSTPFSSHNTRFSSPTRPVPGQSPTRSSSSIHAGSTPARPQGSSTAIPVASNYNPGSNPRLSSPTRGSSTVSGRLASPTRSGFIGSESSSYSNLNTSHLPTPTKTRQTSLARDSVNAQPALSVHGSTGFQPAHQQQPQQQQQKQQLHKPSSQNPPLPPQNHSRQQESQHVRLDSTRLPSPIKMTPQRGRSTLSMSSGTTGYYVDNSSLPQHPTPVPRHQPQMQYLGDGPAPALPTPVLQTPQRPNQSMVQSTAAPLPSPLPSPQKNIPTRSPSFNRRLQPEGSATATAMNSNSNRGNVYFNRDDILDTRSTLSRGNTAAQHHNTNPNADLSNIQLSPPTSVRQPSAFMTPIKPLPPPVQQKQSQQQQQQPQQQPQQQQQQQRQPITPTIPPRRMSTSVSNNNRTTPPTPHKQPQQPPTPSLGPKQPQQPPTPSLGPKQPQQPPTPSLGPKQSHQPPSSLQSPSANGGGLQSPPPQAVINPLDHGNSITFAQFLQPNNAKHYRPAPTPTEQEQIIPPTSPNPDLPTGFAHLPRSVVMRGRSRSKQPGVSDTLSMGSMMSGNGGIGNGLSPMDSTTQGNRNMDDQFVGGKSHFDSGLNPGNHQSIKTNHTSQQYPLDENDDQNEESPRPEINVPARLGGFF